MLNLSQTERNIAEKYLEEKVENLSPEKREQYLDRAASFYLALNRYEIKTEPKE